MQRFLILIRHAEALQSLACAEPDRPLSPRGAVQAESTAQWVASYLPREDRFIRLLVSPALRTRQTAEKLMQNLEKLEISVLQPELYQSSESGILRVIRQIEDEITHLVIIGHNPTLGSFVRRVANLSPACNETLQIELTEFAPSSCCVFSTETVWSHLLTRDLKILAFRDPIFR